MSPLEGRGVVATFDHRLDQLTLYTGAQMPHIVRNGLSDCLGMEQGRIRIVSPDIGGGFGHKGILLPEEVCLAWLTMHKGCAVRWIEDRREHLTASANCREHHYKITAYAERDGRLRGIDCEATVDSGAYSSYPFSACLEAAQVASILPGPYRMPAYRCRTFSVATNKCPILPYRGVARTGVCFALEIMLDAVAVEAGIEPGEVRLRNLVGPDEMPFDNITNKHFDSGDYPQAMRRALAAIDIAAVRARQRTQEPDGRLIGVGLSIYCEQAAHGTSVYAGWGIPMVPGHEQANARMTPDGGLEIRVGVHSHGQGLETTLAQVAHEILGLDTKKVRVVHGDTAITPRARWSWPVVRLELPALKSANAPSGSAPSFFNLIRQWLRCATAVCAVPAAASAFQKSHMPGIGVRRICRPMSIREGWSQPAATSHGATAAPSVMRPTPLPSRSIRISAMSKFSTTSSSKTVACWSIP
jgi:carbon-monoxide dehydrogenase large subunit